MSKTTSKAQMLAVANSNIRQRYARVGTRANWPMINSRLLSIRQSRFSPDQSRVALPRMLEKIAVELVTAGPAEGQHLRQRAQLIVDLLTPRVKTPIPS